MMEQYVNAFVNWVFSSMYLTKSFGVVLILLGIILAKGYKKVMSGKMPHEDIFVTEIIKDFGQLIGGIGLIIFGILIIFSK